MNIASIDDEKLAEIALALARVRTNAEYFVPRIDGASVDDEANFWCFVIAICQQTRTVRGVVEGVPVRGSDYLVGRARTRVLADSQAFSPSAVLRWSADDLLAFFSDTDVARDSTLDRADERLRLLKGVSELLTTRYDSSFLRLVRDAKGCVAGDDGVVARLAECEAYADPARKKSYLLLIFLMRLRIVAPTDPESIGLPIDYHLLRVLLRAGVVRVDDSSFRRRLIDRVRCSGDEDAELRLVASEAGRRIAVTLGGALFEVDNLLWMIGRNCCFYEHDPVCREPKPCAHRTGCSLIESTDYACPDRCPLEGACRASLDADFARLVEPNVETHYY